MLVIEELLAQYGLSIADIAKYAESAVAFGEAYSALRNYVNFTSLYRQTYPGTTREAADLAWRLGKYWFQQGAALSQIDPNQVIPRSLARVSTQASETLGIFQQYNYTVTTGFTNPRTGSIQYYNTIVTSSTPLTLAEALEMAYDTALENIVDYDPWSTGVGTYTDAEYSQSLYSFTRYERMV